MSAHEDAFWKWQPNHDADDEVCRCEICEEAELPWADPLEDAFWSWRQKLNLVTVEDMTERLFQEAALFLATRR